MESVAAILNMSQRKAKPVHDVETLHKAETKVLSVSTRAQKAVPPTHKKL
jgi:hypothetical protein